MLKIKLFLKTRGHSKRALTLNPLTWKIRWAPNNASRWQMGFNSAFNGLSSHFSSGTPDPLSSLEVRRTCDDLNYVLLQVNITEMCIVNMYTVLKLTNKYSLIIIIIIIIIFIIVILVIIIIIIIFALISLICGHVTLNVLCKCKIRRWYCDW
jgi:hypothetical protein